MAPGREVRETKMGKLTINAGDGGVSLLHTPGGPSEHVVTLEKKWLGRGYKVTGNIIVHMGDGEFLRVGSRRYVGNHVAANDAAESITHMLISLREKPIKGLSKEENYAVADALKKELDDMNTQISRMGRPSLLKRLFGRK